MTLDNPDSAAMSRGACTFALRVEDPAELDTAIEEFLAFDLRAVMSGRSDAVLDLAKTNLIR
ncbi:hypothetical protein [uncultured Methylobacterium sp.]|uniref:hypothetical protein n=1 Tax=uncultured Methylobacterium sp. TaxID=157278 RepID=UPI0035CBBF5C